MHFKEKYRISKHNSRLNRGVGWCLGGLGPHLIASMLQKASKLYKPSPACYNNMKQIGALYSCVFQGIWKRGHLESSLTYDNVFLRLQESPWCGRQGKETRNQLKAGPSEAPLGLRTWGSFSLLPHWKSGSLDIRG